MKNIAKKITITRIVLSIVLLFLNAFTLPFFVVYIYCGISTILDGYLAKKRKEETAEETKLDRIANIIFIAAAMYKIIPELYIPLLLFIWLGFVVIIKIYNMIITYLDHKKISLPESKLTKLAGIMFFIAPLIVANSDTIIVYVLLCLVATAAALNETKLIKLEEEQKTSANTMTVQTYNFNQKSK